MKIRVKEILSERAMNQKDLAKAMGVHEMSLSRSLAGNPRLDTLEKISKALNIKVSELFESEGEFSAMIDDAGTLKRFHSKEELLKYLSNGKTK